MGHCQGNRAVGAREREEHFVTVAGGVGEPHVKGDHLGSVVEAAVLDSSRKRHVSLVGFEGVGTEIQNVLAMFDVVEIPVTFPEEGQIRRAAVSACIVSGG